MKQEYLSVKQLAGEIGTNKLTIHRAITEPLPPKGGRFNQRLKPPKVG